MKSTPLCKCTHQWQQQLAGFLHPHSQLAALSPIWGCQAFRLNIHPSAEVSGLPPAIVGAEKWRLSTVSNQEQHFVADDELDGVGALFAKRLSLIRVYLV